MFLRFWQSAMETQRVFIIIKVPEQFKWRRSGSAQSVRAVQGIVGLWTQDTLAVSRKWWQAPPTWPTDWTASFREKNYNYQTHFFPHSCKNYFTALSSLRTNWTRPISSFAYCNFSCCCKQILSVLLVYFLCVMLRFVHKDLQCWLDFKEHSRCLE